MKKILNIIASPLEEASFSNKLGNALIEKIKAEYPGAAVVTRDLTALHVPHMQATHIQAFYTPVDNHTELHRQNTHLSDELIREVFHADMIVMNVPTWNFSIPSSLKAWVDQVSRAGKTFKYGEQGPVGLVTGKKVYLAIASGAIFSEGPYKSFDFVEPYLRAILGFLGMTDLSAFRVEGLAMPGIKDTALEKALKLIETLDVVA